MANTTWNPADKSASVTLSGTNNLTATSTSASNGGVRGINNQSTGKYYWEVTCTTWGANSDVVGFALLSGSLTSGGAGTWVVAANGQIWNGSTNSGMTLGTITSGSIVCVALDLVNDLAWWRVGSAGNWNGSGTANPATQAGGLSFGSVGPVYPLGGFGTTSGHALTANFGDTAFTGALPSGFNGGFLAGAPTQARVMVMA